MWCMSPFIQVLLKNRIDNFICTWDVSLGHDEEEVNLTLLFLRQWGKAILGKDRTKELRRNLSKENKFNGYSFFSYRCIFNAEVT